MRIKKPVFVLGTGRSGSTAFFNVLTRHTRVAYLTSLNERYPSKPWLNHLFMLLIDSPSVPNLLMKIIQPSEAYTFWEYNCRGFRRPCRDLRSDDATPRAKSRIVNALQTQLTKRRDSFFTKITGWPRIAFLKQIFPDARFIHIVRDGRAVANSLLDVDFWWGWRGPENWRLGSLPQDLDEEWKKYDRSFIALAGIHWKILVDAVQLCKAFLAEDEFIEIKYEDLCESPVEVYRKSLAFTGLEWTDSFEACVRKSTFTNTNYKWRRDLTEEQQRILCEVLSPQLERLGYTNDYRFSVNKTSGI
ncbi:MAG: sulfotransferase [Candidatus Hodarchaeota archaeon]